MANTIRIKRRASNSGSGAALPTGLYNAELAFNEVNNTLYIGRGGDATGAQNNATATVVAGDGVVWTGTQTFGTVNAGGGVYAYKDTYPVDPKLLATVEYVDDAISRGAGATLYPHAANADCATTAPLLTAAPYDKLQSFEDVRVAWAPTTLASYSETYPLSGAKTLQGVTLANGNRVLLLNHLQPGFKGIWIVNTSGAWTRATGAEYPAFFTTGKRIKVTEGTNANKIYEVAAPADRPTNENTRTSSSLTFNITTSQPVTSGTAQYQRVVRAASDVYTVENNKIKVDGVVLNDGDRFLWMPMFSGLGGADASGDPFNPFGDPQATGGIYRVDYSAVTTSGTAYAAAVRDQDLMLAAQFQSANGTKVLVREGTTNKQKIYTINAATPFTVGTTVPTFTFSSNYSETAGGFKGTPIIDGYTTQVENLGSGQIGTTVLVKDEIDATYNGLYYIPALSGGYTTANVPWIRHPTADAAGELVYGSYIRVLNGSVNKNLAFVQIGEGGEDKIITPSNESPAGVGTPSNSPDLIVFQSAQASSDIVAGVGLAKANRTLYVKTASSSRITVTEAGVDLATLSPNPSTDQSTAASAYILTHVDAYGRVTDNSSTTITATDFRNKLSSVSADDTSTGTGSVVFSNSPTFTGNVVVPHPTTVGATYTNSTAPATQGYVDEQIATSSGNNLLGADNTWTGSNTFRKTTGTRFEQAATQDAIVVTGRNGGNASYEITLTPATLSADRTITLPDATTTLVGHDVGTGTATSSFATGATANATTKTVNIGPNGVSGSTTAVNIGSTNTNGAITNVTVGATTSSGFVDIKATTGSTSTTTGALIVRGGAGIGENLFVGGNVTISSGKALNLSNTTVTAGTNAQGQGALTNDINIVTSAAAAPSGVTLPAGTAGRVVVVVNRSSQTNTVNVYPASGGTINALAANAAFAVAANSTAIFRASSATQWYSELVDLANATTGTLAVGSGGTGATTFTNGALLKGAGANAITTATSGTDYAPATSGSSILKGNGSGGFSSATSGTDYAPATSGSSILKGNGSGGFSSATSGTDYAPATSGSSILKGNGSGGFSSATAGTDYVVAGTTTVGKIVTQAAVVGAASLLITPQSATPTTLAAGDLWNDAGTLKFRQASATKDIAFTDSTITGNAANVTGTVAIGNGGTGLTSYTVGDMLYYASGTALSKVTKPSAAAVLFNDNAGTPSWVATTGSDNVVRATSPVFATSVTTNDATFAVFNTNGATSLSAFGGATGTLNVGPTTSGTTLNLASGGMTTGTRTINIGTGATGGTSNVVLGSTGATSTVTVNKDLVVAGNLTVSGTTTIFNTNTLTVEDKNIEIGNVAALSNISSACGSGVATLNVPSTDGMMAGQEVVKVSGTGTFGSPAIGPVRIASVDSAIQITLNVNHATPGPVVFNLLAASNFTAVGGGITLKGTSDKTFQFTSADNTGDGNSNWTSSEHLNVASGKVYKINNTEVLSATALGSNVTSSSLTTVGTLTSGSLGVGFTTVAVARGGTGQTSFTANGVLLGNTASGLNVTAAGTANQVLRVPSAGGAPAFGTIATDGIADSAVTNAKLRNSDALSVIGRSANTSGAPADIASTTDGHVLRQSGTALGFGTIATAGITDNAVSFAKLTNSAAAGLSVVGRSTNSAGNFAEINAGTDGHVLRRSGTTLDFGTIATAGITDNAVTFAKLLNSAAAGLSVVGRSTNSAGNFAEINAATDGHVLRRSGTAIGFGTIATAGLADGAVTNAKVADGTLTAAKFAAGALCTAVGDCTLDGGTF